MTEHEIVEDKNKHGFFRRKPRNNEVGITGQDVLAMIIAAFQVFLPIFLMIGGIIFLLLLLMLKFWIK